MAEFHLVRVWINPQHVVSKWFHLLKSVVVHRSYHVWYADLEVFEALHSAIKLDKSIECSLLTRLQFD